MALTTITLGALTLTGTAEENFTRIRIDKASGFTYLAISHEEWSSLEAASRTLASASVALATSAEQLLAADLRAARYSAALREALEMVASGCKADRFDVLWAFLNGEREGL